MISINYIKSQTNYIVLRKNYYFNKEFVYYINRQRYYDKIEVDFYMCNSYSFYKIKTNDDLYNYIFDKDAPND